MQLSNLDTAIRDSVQAINAGSTKNPSYCGWMPTMITRANEVLQYVTDNYPAFIQFVENKSVQLSNGQIKRTIDFYVVNPRTDDVLSCVHNLDELEKYIFQFRDNLSNYYKCELTGQMTRSLD